MAASRPPHSSKRSPPAYAWWYGSRRRTATRRLRRSAQGRAGSCRERSRPRPSSAASGSSQPERRRFRATCSATSSTSCRTTSRAGGLNTSSDLTPREREVLALVADGHPTGTSPTTWGSRSTRSSATCRTCSASSPSHHAPLQRASTDQRASVRLSDRGEPSRPDRACRPARRSSARKARRPPRPRPDVGHGRRRTSTFQPLTGRGQPLSDIGIAGCDLLSDIDHRIGQRRLARRSASRWHAGTSVRFGSGYWRLRRRR